VEQERRSAALAARVATALTREAMRQPYSEWPAPRIAWHEPPEGEELLIFTLEDNTQDSAPQDEALEPLEPPKDLDLIFEPLALPAPLPCAAADPSPTPQG